LAAPNVRIQVIAEEDNLEVSGLRVPGGDVDAELDGATGAQQVDIRKVVRTGVDADVVCAVVGGDARREGVGVGAGLGCSR